MRRFFTLFLVVANLLAGQLLLAQNVEELWIENGGRRIYGVLSHPSDTLQPSPIAIISHGFNGTHAHGRNYFETLNALGYQCYTFDFPCGSTKSLSDNNTKNMSIFDEQHDLEAIVRFFKGRTDVDSSNIVLIGESQGGLVSALAAGSIPNDISKLILIFPAFCIPDNWNARYQSLEEIPETTSVWGVPLGRRYFEEIHSLSPFDFIGKFGKPVLIIQGDADKIVSLEDSRKALNIYKDARLHVIKGAGHGFKGEELKESMSEIGDFLR